MEVIFRKGLRHSVVTAVGTVLGAVNILFLYTYFLTEKEFGLFQYLVSWAKFIVPFVTLGIETIAIRYYSVFREKSEKNNGFLFFLLIVPLISFALFCLGYFLIEDTILQTVAKHPNAALLTAYLPFILGLVLVLLISSVLSTYISNKRLIVVPEILNNLWFKIAIPINAILYFLEILSLTDFIWSILFSYILSTLGMIIYVWQKGALDLRPNWKFFNKDLIKDMGSFGLYYILAGTGTMIATRIDMLMVGSLIDMENAGIYTIALFITSVIAIPYRSVITITSPIVAELINKNDFGSVNKIYSKTSLNLFVLGMLLLIGIWVSVDLVFQIIPKGEIYKSGKYVILFLGLAKIVDMSTSINSSIIVYSKHYKFNLYLSAILAILNIIFNLIFIPQFQLVGVAMATLSSMIIFNLLKVIFVWIKFKIQPFSKNMLWVLLVAFLAYFSAYFCPKTGFPILDILINSLIILLTYIPFILHFNLSNDLTLLKQRLIKRFGKD